MLPVISVLRFSGWVWMLCILLFRCGLTGGRTEDSSAILDLERKIMSP